MRSISHRLPLVSIRALLVPALALAFATAPVVAWAQGGGAKATDDKPSPVMVDVNGSSHVRLGQAITRFSVGSPEIASAQAFPPDQLLIVGKVPGSTIVTIWTREGDVVELPVHVGFPTAALDLALARAIPESKNLHAQAAGATIVLTGEVKSVADAETAEQLAKGYAASAISPVAAQVLNRINVTGDYQVQLEVSFAEVSRSALKEIGLNFWGSKGDYTGTLVAPTSTVTSVGSSGATPPVLSTFGLVVSSVSESFPFNAALSILAQRGYSRTLSEPTLVAMSGQEAVFHAGGEFPVPIPQSLGAVSIEYKKYGIQLRFVPTVVGETIQLSLDTAVSDVDTSLAIKLSDVTVPGISERRSSTTIRLRDGQSFAIAGLINDRVRSSVEKVPGLGDLPVLGALFRSTTYRRDETELLLVVTAHLVRAGDTRPRLPGEDTTIDPSDLEIFLLGSVESKRGGGYPRAARRPAGPVGFVR